MEERYFNWMCRKVKCTGRHKLLRALHDEEFIAVMDIDDNRTYDGINLRYIFGEAMDISRNDAHDENDPYVCSVLEMMIGLSSRIEDTYMEDHDFGDRTAMWFWTMVKSLGLYEMTDSKFDIHYTLGVMSRFIHRDYEPNGAGSLFTIDDNTKDMRNIEIWYQMGLFINSILYYN